MIEKMKKFVFFFGIMISLAVIGTLSAIFLESVYLEQVSLILIMIAFIPAMIYYLNDE